MFKCIFIKRKLYDYLNGALSEIDKIEIEGHLEACVDCRKRLERMQNLIELIESKKASQPSEDFWHNFRTELDKNLNDRLVSPLHLQPNLGYRLRPVFVYVSALIFILFFGLFISKGYILRQGEGLTEQDEALIDEVIILDETSPQWDLNHSEDAYIDELNLLYQLDQDLI